MASVIPVVIFLMTPPPLLSVSLGGGEDYRQDPAESHQSTEGEWCFYGRMATLMSWFPALMASPLVILELRSLCFFAL